jgi:hypothetical protein
MLFPYVQKRDDEKWMKHTVSWLDMDTGAVKLGYRPVHTNTLDAAEVSSFPPMQRTY